jgi:CspA family cold shock protein
MRLAGKVIRFDNVRGYGFITPDGGGDDVFLHANDLEMEKLLARPGVRVSFDVEEGERGQFATSVRPCGGSAGEVGGQGVSFGGESSSDEYIDVLSAAEFEHAVTELLLTVTPPLSAPQIVSVRAAFAQMAHQQSWLDA